jgi:hypothetical protein
MSSRRGQKLCTLIHNQSIFQQNVNPPLNLKRQKNDKTSGSGPRVEPESERLELRNFLSSFKFWASAVFLLYQDKER